MIFRPAGLATGIGSLPFTEPEEALGPIWENLPEIPHWPQLPQRGREEGFVFQFLTPLVKTGVLTVDAGSGRAFFNTAAPAWAERLTEFYDLYLRAQEGDREALAEFAFPREAAAGFYAFAGQVKERGAQEALYFKGQLAGPLTIGFALKDEQGRPAYYNEQLRELIRQALALHARWQALALAGLGRPAIIFIDDPGVSVYGRFSFITVTKEMIAADLGEIVRAVHGAGALAGVHSCDAIDWSILFADELALDIVNLDAYNFGESLYPYAREAGAFLERGGAVAWGIVPTSEKAGEEDEQNLAGKLAGLWGELEKRGLPRELLKRQALITPACGAGLLAPELARRIYRLTRAVSGMVRAGGAGCLL
ncbi:MAG: hypothetical protein AB1523_08840 [Bacillota bacterium]